MISIDAKKKELLGEFKNGGSDYSPQGWPIEVNTHDFEDKELGVSRKNTPAQLVARASVALVEPARIWRDRPHGPRSKAAKERAEADEP